MKLATVRQTYRNLRLLLLVGWLTMPFRCLALTVAEVAKDLACPCQCPLILGDCNMSCGLEWKDDIGKLIQEGMTKQQIIDHFIAEHGEDARLSATQRIHGKIFQYTRSFGTADWVLLWTGVLGWLSLMFFGVYVGVKRITSGRSRVS
jgi:cytochrome c-type biogenesis protein CcmH/NrfF